MGDTDRGARNEYSKSADCGVFLEGKTPSNRRSAPCLPFSGSLFSPCDQGAYPLGSPLIFSISIVRTKGLVGGRTHSKMSAAYLRAFPLDYSGKEINNEAL